VVDRFGAMRMGRRRFWVVLAMAGSLTAQSCLLWLGDARPGALWGIALVFTLHSLCAALMDTATDAMIIDHTPADQLGAATACTRAGFVSGFALGGAAFAWVLPQASLGEAAALLLAVGALAAILPLLVRERACDAVLSLRRGTQPAGLGVGTLLAELFGDITQPAHIALLLSCLAQDFFGALFRLPLGVYLIQDAGWSPASLSTAQGGVGLVAGTLGAWLVGRWTDRVGPARALGQLLMASAVAHLASGVVLGLGGGWAGPVALSLSTVTSALCFVALAPAVMQASRGAVAASRFALYMAALNLGDVLGSALSGVAAAVGIAPLALLVAAGYGGLALTSRRMVTKLQTNRDGFNTTKK